MKDQATNVLKSIQQFWKSRAKKQKIIYISVFIGIIVVAIVLSMLMNRKDYAVLFSGLDKTEANEIVTEIQGMKIDAQVKADGSILVPKDQENQLRMQLATKGYPKSGFSYDIWTKNVNMFTTDSQKKEVVKMQLQERLQATIKTLSGIEDAIVTLDIPERSNTVISTNQKEASASVVVHLKPGVTLSSNQISGITHTVMKSISGLKEDNVSVVDQNANLLVGGNNGTDSVVVETQRLQFKKSFEAQLQNEVRKLLTPSYGDSGMNISVNAVFNYDKKLSQNTKYTPSVGDNGVIQHQDESKTENTDGSSGGAVGVDPNADPGTYPTQNGTSSNGTWSESSKSTSYLVNELKEQSEKNGVYVDKVTVSVVLYKDSLASTEKEKVMNIVANSTGTLPEFVSIENLPSLNEIKPGDTKTNSNGVLLGLSLTQLIIYGAIAVVAILLFFIIIAMVFGRKGKKAQKGKNVKNGKQKLAMAGVAQIEEEAPQIDIKKLTGKQPETKEAAIRHEIGDFAKSSPEIAAQLLKSWIREEGD